MAHVAKYKISATGHMFNHYGRSDNLEKSAYVIRGNENIKPSKTHLNYNLAKNIQPNQQLNFLKERLSQVKVQKRADLNVFCDWVITAPKSLPKKDEKAFFQTSYDFLIRRYGKENVISAYVHMDETTPHMHFAFIPIVEDKKRGGYKVSAKELLTKYELKSFHGDLEKELKNVLGYEVGILNEATREGNQSINELKRKTAIKKVLQLEERAYDLEKDIEKVQANLKDLMTDKNRLQGFLESYKGILDDIRGKEKFIKEFSPQKSLMGGIKGVTIEDIEILKEIALDGLNANQRVQEANKTIECLEIKNNSLESLNKKLYEEKSELIEKAEVNYKKGYEKATKEWDEFEWERNKQMVKDGFNWDTEIYPYGIYEKDSIGHILEEIKQEREIRKSQDWDLEL